MSIINKMLQELDRRHAPEGPPTAPGGSPGKLAMQVRTVRPSRAGSPAFWWIVALLILLAAAGAVFVSWYGRHSGRTADTALLSDALKTPVPSATVQPRTQTPAAPASVTGPGAPNEPDARTPNGAATVQPVPTPSSAQPERTEPPKIDTLRLATGIDTPIAERLPKPARSPGDRETVQSKAAPAAQARAPEAAQSPQSAPAKAPAPAQSSTPAAPARAASAANATETVVPPRPAVKPAPSLHELSGADSGRIDKRISQSTRERAEGEFRRAMTFVNQGRMSEGMDGLRAALSLDPTYEAARQTLVSLLLEAKRSDDAAAALEQGLALNPANTGSAMLLARMRVDRGNLGGALDLLQRHESAAQNNGEYRAFVAALLQRLGRHEEAIQEYVAALVIAPGVGAWWVGLGISQEAANLRQQAAESFRRAKQTGALNANLAAYADQRLRQLQ